MITRSSSTGVGVPIAGMIAGLLAGMILTLSGCGGDSLPDNERLLQAFEQSRTGVWVSGHGTVTQILPDLNGNNPRQRFNVAIEGQTWQLLLINELDGSERVPVERGDVVAFQGRYDFFASGGTLSLTFADPAQPGGGGWIEHKGRRYD